MHSPVIVCVSLSIPYRSPCYRSAETMDEMMAALVLTSLSCSPLVPSPPQRDTVTGNSLTE